MILLLVLLTIPALLTLGTLVVVYRWVVATPGSWHRIDLAAQRRGRHIACAGLAEVAAAHPEAARMAMDALLAASLPGDPTPAELLRGPG